MTIEALEGVTDQDLFDEANADEAPADEVVVEVPEAEPEQEEQPRDEAGRFATPVAEEPAPAEAPLTTVDDNAAMVPSWRVREINDEKRALADRVAAFEAEKLQWQRQQPAPQPAKEPEKVVKPDPLLDPEGYEAYLDQKFEEKRVARDREVSMKTAHKTYKTEFEEAYAAAQKQIDPVLRARMQNTDDPGETLIEWHREQKTRAEVGNDPNAFFDRRLEAFLKDPANQAKVLERIRGGVQPQQQPPGAPKAAPATFLPPSLTRATNASTATAGDDDDISNDGLWRHANA